MDNPIHDMMGKTAYDVMQAANTVLSFQRETAESDKTQPFVMYRSYRDAYGEMQMIEVARGVCTNVEDFGKDVPPPVSPRKIENRAVLSFKLPL